MKKYIVLLALSLCLCITACGTKIDNQTETTENISNEQTAETEDESEEVEAEASNEIEAIEEQESNSSSEESENIVLTDQTEGEILSQLTGEWVGHFDADNRSATCMVSIKADAQFTVRIEYDPDGWTNYTYNGHIEVEPLGDESVAVFCLDKTDDNNWGYSKSIGDFYVDGVRLNDYDGKNLYLTQANNGDSIFSMYFNDFRPVLYSYVDPYGEGGAKFYEVECPSYEYYSLCTDTADRQYELVKTDLQKNEITDTDTWHYSIGRVQPDYYWMDDKYIYCKSNVKDYEYTQLNVYDNTSDDGEGELLYTFDMSNYQYVDSENESSAFAQFTTQGIKYALIKDDVLYISTGHRTYTDACPLTGYITAIDINDGHVIWKTHPQMCNSYSFDFVGDTIVCGYGFTAEDDKLNIIDCRTGKLIESIDVLKMVEYVCNVNNELKVRTYSYDYTFSINPVQ